MKCPASPFAILFAALLMTAPFAQAASSGGKVKLEQQAGTINVTVDGKPFTTYHFDAKDDPKFARPYLYPVLAADGTPLTADQVSRSRPTPRPTTPTTARSTSPTATSTAPTTGHWLPRTRHACPASATSDSTRSKATRSSSGSSGSPPTAARRCSTKPARSASSRFDDGSRGIDLTVALTPAGDKPVTLKDTKEAGLCSVRVAKAISDKPTLTNAAGQTGEKDTWGKPAAWCDISGKINAKPYGVAVLDHPSNPRHPTRWHVREYGLLSANPFGLHDYDKSNPAGTGNMELKPGTTTTFRYRVVFHAGDAKSAKLDEKFAAFAKE